MRKKYAGRHDNDGEFIFEIDTSLTGGSTSPNNQFYLPISNGTSQASYVIAFQVDWGDGTTSDVNASNYSTECLHTYAASGTYTIKCSGTVAGFAFQSVPAFDDSLKLLNIQKWGCFKMDGGRAGSGAGLNFMFCSNMTEISATDIPNNTMAYSGDATNRGYRGPFFQCTDLVRINNISNWVVAHEPSTNNSPVMNIMFYRCTKLQFGDMGTGIIDMSGWDVTNVWMWERFMFGCNAFDGKLFSNLGASAPSYSLPGGRLDNMFYQCTNFTGSNSVTELQAWDTSFVTRMDNMFRDCTVFNVDIGMWDTSSVTNMSSMFYDATSFDQDISGWQIAQVTSLTGFLGNGQLSTANYDLLLVAWDAQGTMSFSGTANFGNSTYSLTSPGNVVVNARNSLIAKWGAILDGGGV